MTELDFHRDVSRLEGRRFDVVIVGGGIYGSWAAYHAAVAGLNVALVEQSDWGSATSSASSKLLHGGLRYLERFEFGLVRKSLHERRELNRLLPHLVRPLRFLVPVYTHSRVGRLRLKAGLWLYDRLAGANQPVGPHQSFSAVDLQKLEPALTSEQLVGGFSYGDCATDDARMVLQITQSAVQAGATACSYVRAEELLQSKAQVTGLRLLDAKTGRRFQVETSVVLNASGPWVFRQLGLNSQESTVRVTRGVHLVMPSLGSDHAILLTSRSDGRVFFLIPWYGRTLLGTTDTDYRGDPDCVRVEQDDVDYLLAAANDYLQVPWTADDIHGSFAGLRTLQNESQTTASGVSREWSLQEPLPGVLVSVGGKLTSARVDAAQAVRRVCELLNRSSAESLPISLMAGSPSGDFAAWMARLCKLAVDAGIDSETAATGARRHGTRFRHIVELVHDSPDLATRIVRDLPFCRAEVVHAAMYEMPQCLMDIIRRRIPLTVLSRLDHAAVNDICSLAANVLKWDTVRQEQEIMSVSDNCLRV